MKIAIRAAAALAALLALAGVAAAVLLPRLLGSEALRARIQAAAERALGLEVRYATLGVGWLPPSLVVTSPAVAERGSAQPLVEAEEVALRVALAPLLSRAVVVDSLVIEGATVRVERTRDGFTLPLPAPGEVKPAPGGGEGEGGGGPPVSIALRGVELRRSSVVLVDRAVSPAVTWELRDVDVRLRGGDPDAPFDVEASLALASGGRLAVKGTAALGGRLDLDVDLTRVALAPARPYLAGLAAGGGGGEIAGELSGEIRIRGAAASPDALTLDLSLENGVLELQEMALRGPLAVKADLSGPLATPRGSFELDATRAALRYGEVFTKPPGTAATVKGRVAPGAAGALEIDDMRLQIRDLDARARIETGKRSRVTLRPEPLELDGWEELVPALAAYELRGPVRAEEIVVRTAPLDVRGALNLDGVHATLAQGREVLLRGALLAEGSRIRSRDLQLVAADQVVALEAELDDLGGARPFRVRARAQDADANRVLTSFAGSSNLLTGLLGLEADLAGSAGGTASGLEALRGTVRFDLREGRVVGVSLLRSAVEGLGQAAQLASLPIGALGKAAELARFYGDAFETVSGTLNLADGVVRSDDLRAVYRNYSLDARGTFDLRSLGCDLLVNLAIGPEVERALLGGAPGAAPAGARPARVIPVPVRGTPCDPKRPAGISQAVALSFWRSYLPKLVPELAPLGGLLDRINEAAGAKRQ